MRTSDEEMSMRGMSKKVTRSAAPGSSRSRRSSTWSRPTPSRAATPSAASERMASGSRHSGSEEAMSPPTMKVSWSPGRASWSLERVSTVYERPGTSASARETPSRASPPTAATHNATRCSTPGSRSASLCGGVWTGTSSTRSRPSCDHAFCAQTSGPMCGGWNVPPSSPIRATASGPDLAVALDQVLEGAQLARADRPAGMQLLRRVADLGAHPELAPVGEAGGGVDVDARRVHAELERPRGGRVAREDRLRVARPVRVNVLDRLLRGRDDLHREHERQELLRPVRLAGRRNAAV